MRKKVAATLVALTMSGAFLAFSTGPALAAPPGNCDTTADYGIWDAEHNSGHVGGRWVNCGSTWDTVYIEVNNASDSNCVYVGPNTSLQISYNPTFWGPVGNHNRTWKRC